jgi:hypothetical protein
VISRETADSLCPLQTAAWRWLAARLWRLSQVAERAGWGSVSVLLADRAMDFRARVEIAERPERDREYVRQWHAERGARVRQQ